MLKYIIKRIVLSVIILFGVSLIIYILVRIQPGENFVRKKFGAQLQQDTSGQTLAQVEKQEHIYGLDVHPLKGYWMWLGNVLKGDWGESFVHSVSTGKIEVIETTDPVTGETIRSEKPGSSKRVFDVIFQKSRISFLISLVAMVFEYIIAIPLGIISATKQYGVVDYTVTILAMMGISLPTFFLGALMLKIFSIDLGLFPYAGLNDPNTTLPKFVDNLWHLVLPLTTLVILSIGGLMRYTRTNMLEVLNADYIRTARAKGLSEKTVIYKHAFRNSLIPLVTMLAGVLPGLFGGAMITETVFSIDGIGKAAYTAVLQGDIPFVMAYNMFISLLTIIGTLFSDLMYAVVDPRVKLTD